DPIVIEGFKIVMKIEQKLQRKGLALWSGIVVCIAMHSVQGAQNPAKSPAKPAAPVATTNAPPPKSIFILPRSPLEGKDPFYPRSMWIDNRGVPVQPVASINPTPVVVDVDLKLSGISGTREHPLAI